jgi:tetratricopeptide (TPR) repeat protein
MSDNQRIDDLRRRVQKDPSSIAFAQLAEECRRAGRHQEAVDVCRAGLDIHPGYLSARVTLGRALIELDALDDAQSELDIVLRSAPENLAAIRGLAEIHHRRGSLAEALFQYRRALGLARNDPDLQRTVADLERIVEPPKPPASDDGLSFALLQSEFLQHLPPPPPRPPAPPVLESGSENSPPAAEAPVVNLDPVTPVTDRPPDPVSDPPAVEPPAHEDEPPAHEEDDDDEPEMQEDASPVQFVADTDGRSRALSTIAALEQWLGAIHVARTQPGA